MKESALHKLNEAKKSQSIFDDSTKIRLEEMDIFLSALDVYFFLFFISNLFFSICNCMIEKTETKKRKKNIPPPKKKQPNNNKQKITAKQQQTICTKNKNK